MSAGENGRAMAAGGTADGARIRVAAILAVHNRRELTLECLRSLRAQQIMDASLDIYVLDDASSDGTAEAIGEQYPDVVLLQGDGDQFWNGGMRAAFGAALERDYDHYLWANDDTRLDDGALTTLLDTARDLARRGTTPPIVVGTTRHPDTGELTYGGRVRPSPRQPLRWELVEPSDVPRPCETMNGNIVLIPRPVAQRVGNIDPAFIQKMGDHDYGLRAREAGCSVWVAPGVLGECASHPPRRTDLQPFVQEWRRAWSPKELPFRQWAIFCRRWAGPAWPLYFASPYVRRGLRLARERLPLLGGPTPTAG